MADDEVRTPPEPKRPGQATPNRDTRRQAPVIDGTAEEIRTVPGSPADPVSGDAASPLPGDAASGAGSDPADDPSGHEPSVAAGAADLAASEPVGNDAAAPGEGTDARRDDAAPPRRSRFPALLLVLGLVLLGLLGAVLYTLYNPPPNEAVASLSAETAGLKQRLATLEARPSPDVAPLNQRLGATEAALKQLKADLADTRSKLDDLAKTETANAGASAPAAQPNAAPPAPAVDLGPLQAKVADLDQSVTALQGALAALPKVDLAPLQGKVADLGQGLSTAQAAIAAVQAAVAAVPKVDLAPIENKIAALDRRLTPIEAALSAPKAPDRVTQARQEGNAAETRAAPLAVTAQAVLDALRTGKPFGPEVAALQSLGVDEAKLAKLRPLADKGAPTGADLLTQFEGIKDRMLAADAPKVDGDVLDRMVASARNLVRVRPAGASRGSDPDAVVSRIEADLRDGDFEAAQSEWAKLPADAKAQSQSWADRLNARAEADAAARSIVAQAIAALGASK